MFVLTMIDIQRMCINNQNADGSHSERTIIKHFDLCEQKKSDHPDQSALV